MSSRTVPWKVVALTTTVFLLDCVSLPDWPFSLGYVVCVLLAGRGNSAKNPSTLAAIIALLALIAQLLSASRGPWYEGLGHRVFASVVCWLVADFFVRTLQIQARMASEVEQKQAQLEIEKKLRESESRYRAHLDHASDAVFLFNNQGVVLDVNQQACDSLGYGRSELIGQSPPFFANVQSVEFLNQVIATLNQGQKVSFDGFHRHQVNGPFPVEVRICPFTSEGQRLALGIARNITERKKIEEDLRDSERKFRELADAIPQIVWIAGADWNMIHFNARAAEYTGVSVEELNGPLWARFIHPDDLADVQMRLMETIQSGATQDAEVRLRRFDGEYRWHICRQVASRNPQGEIERWYGTCTDIEAQKRTEAALRDSEKRFVGFMQHFPGFAWIKNLDGTYIFANSRFNHLVEGRFSSVCGLTDHELFEPDDAIEFRRGDLQAIESSSGINEIQQVPAKTRDASQYFVAKFGIPGPTGSAALVGGMAIDITEQKRAELAIVRQNRIMERIATGSSLNEILMLIVELMEDRIPDSFFSIMLYDAHENRLRMGVAPSLPAEYIQAVDGVVAGPDAGCCGAAVHRREAVVARDLLTSPLWEELRDVATACGLRSCWSVPIFSRPREDAQDDHRRVLGTFAIYKSVVWDPTDWEIEIMATAIYLASVAIERDADDRSLKESEQRYRALLDHAPVGIYVNVDNRFVYVNDATCRLMGATSRDQLIGKPTLERFHPSVVPAIRERIERMLKYGESAPWLAHQYLRLDGSEVDVETIGIPIQFGNRAAIQVLINDISERKVAEEKLNATVKRLESLFRASPVGICISTMDEGVVLEANDIYVNLAGYDREEIIGHPTIEFGQWPDPAARTQLVAELKRSGSVKNWEIGFRRKDGTYGYSLRSFERLELDGRDCILTMLSDVTARKQIDEELRISRQRLEVLSRQLITAQEIERRHLARELHDEIGQILTAIKINLNRSQKEADLSRLVSLEDNISLVDQAISQVRDLSLSLRPPQLDQLGLVAALHWIVKHQARIGSFEEDLDADIGDLQVADDVAIVCFRITQEALTNAVRHARPQHVHVRLSVVKNELQLLIEDDGVGFDVAMARQRATHGASFGLLSMQERVHLVGGQFEIDSIIGHGTKIRSRFPIESAVILDAQL